MTELIDLLLQCERAARMQKVGAEGGGGMGVEMRGRVGRGGGGVGNEHKKLVPKTPRPVASRISPR